MPLNKEMDSNKTITVNRRVFYDYEVLERIEAGLVLKGTEIKSIRAGQVNIREAYVRPQDGELWLVNAHIALYQAGGMFNNHDPIRPRKLLLHKDQMVQLISTVTQKGLTIKVLSLYIKGHVAKVQVGLVRGKRQYDKRRAIIDRDRDREAQRALRRSVTKVGP